MSSQRPSLEVLSWIAGILSALISLYAYLRPPSSDAPAQANSTPAQQPSPIPLPSHKEAALVATSPANPPAVASASDPRPKRSPPSVARAEAAKIVTQSSAEPFTYFAQAGVYPSAEQAERARSQLSDAGLTGRVVQQNNQYGLLGASTAYLVRVGPYDTKQQADNILAELPKLGFDQGRLIRVQR